MSDSKIGKEQLLVYPAFHYEALSSQSSPHICIYTSTTLIGSPIHQRDIIPFILSSQCIRSSTYKEESYEKSKEGGKNETKKLLIKTSEN